MSTLPLPKERTPFDLLFRNLFKTDGAYQPTTFDNKQSHPLDIFYDGNGLHFEVACTGLTKEDIDLEIDGDLLKITYDKPEEEEDYSGYIYKGLAKRSFNLGYKVAATYELEKLTASMKDGLLHIFIPINSTKSKSKIKIK
jgi:HSP20 family molecular chaperone IbpA